MKIFAVLLIFSMIGAGNFIPTQGGNVEFVCHKMNKSSNTCHFNFIVDGARYRYVDVGCKKSKKKEEIIKKAKDGELALAKDWKIDCPEAKQKE